MFVMQPKSIWHGDRRATNRWQNPSRPARPAQFWPWAIYIFCLPPRVARSSHGTMFPTLSLGVGMYFSNDVGVSAVLELHLKNLNRFAHSSNKLRKHSLVVRILRIDEVFLFNLFNLFSQIASFALLCSIYTSVPHIFSIIDLITTQRWTCVHLVNLVADKQHNICMRMLTRHRKTLQFAECRIYQHIHTLFGELCVIQYSSRVLWGN